MYNKNMKVKKPCSIIRETLSLQINRIIALIGGHDPIVRYRECVFAGINYDDSMRPDGVYNRWLLWLQAHHPCGQTDVDNDVQPVVVSHKEECPS